MNFWYKMASTFFKKKPADVATEQCKEVTECFYKECETNGEIKVFPYTADPTGTWKIIKYRQHHEEKTPLPPETPISDDKLRFVCVSDTHSRTGRPDMAHVPDGDVLLHAGDFTMVGQPEEVDQFNQWLGTMPHTHKVVIAGNHDLMFEDKKLETDWMHWNLNPQYIQQYLSSRQVSHVRELLTNCTYLEDAETSVCGVRIYGSPWQPEFGSWAYNLKRGEACLEKWRQIPEGIDVLMTHGPPIGHGDECVSGLRAGCVELLHSVQMRIKPKYHVFGHIHEAAGVTSDGTTTFINACTCDLRYRPDQPAVVFDVPIPDGHTKAELADKLTVISHSKAPRHKLKISQVISQTQDMRVTEDAGIKDGSDADGVVCTDE